MKKNKRNIWIPSIICVLSILLFLLFLLLSKNSVNNEENNKNWMSEIADEKKLSEIFIPGAHNATTSNIPLSLFARCQNQTTLELLNDGYRYLDIRAGVDEVKGEKRLVLYHNFIPCYGKDGIIPSKLTFEEVVTFCYDFLDAYPSETIIFMIKYEHGDVSVSEFEKLIEKTIDKNSDKWLLTDTTPSLKEARGKIVLYRRYKDEAQLGKKAGIECIWDEQRNTDISDMNSMLTSLNAEGLFVQDMFKLTTDDKWLAFSCALNSESQNDNTEGNYPHINFLSTAGNGSVGVPVYFAKILNKRLMDFDFDEEICPQWIIVDFGDESIATKIIKANAYIK